MEGPRFFIVEQRRKYTLWSFFGDFIMTCLTCGFWLIYIFVREMRNR